MAQPVCPVEQVDWSAAWPEIPEGSSTGAPPMGVAEGLGTEEPGAEELGLGVVGTPEATAASPRVCVTTA